jgi:hypothetical protein
VLGKEKMKSLFQYTIGVLALFAFVLGALHVVLNVDNSVSERLGAATFLLIVVPFFLYPLVQFLKKFIRGRGNDE